MRRQSQSLPCPLAPVGDVWPKIFVLCALITSAMSGMQLKLTLTVFRLKILFKGEPLGKCLLAHQSQERFADTCSDACAECWVEPNDFAECWVEPNDLSFPLLFLHFSRVGMIVMGCFYFLCTPPPLSACFALVDPITVSVFFLFPCYFLLKKSIQMVDRRETKTSSVMFQYTKRRIVQRE